MGGGVSVKEIGEDPRESGVSVTEIVLWEVG